MLERFLTLFKPTPPPPNGLKKWTEVQATCQQWAGANEIQSDFLQRSYLGRVEADKYLQMKEALLLELTAQGQTGLKSIRELEKLYSKPAVGTTRSKEYKDAGQNFESHVHVTTKVMAEFDQIYLKHYSPNAVLALCRCFNMMGSSQASEPALAKYRNYLSEVKTKLQRLSSSADCSVAAEGGDLQAIGLKHAAEKLEPLYGPIFGRICLPIPTTSMLADLKACLEIDEEILGEVVHFRT